MIKKLKESEFLSKISNISSYFWFLGTLSFILVILISTKNFTIDPCYSEGCSEQKYFLPMLLSFFIGAGAFGITIFSGFLRIVFKAPKTKPFLSLGSLKIGFLTFTIAIIFLVYMIGIFRGGKSVMWGSSWTGDDLWKVVNEHRRSVGVNELKLSEGLCDNLVERWKAVKEGRQHQGFEEWVKQEGITTNYGYKNLAELYVAAGSPAEAVAFWVKSPGHKVQLENKEWVDGCAYANEGLGIIVMGNK